MTFVTFLGRPLALPFPWDSQLYLYYWWQVSVLLPGATSAGCGCGDSGCGLCLELGVLSIPVASGPAVLHQATLPTLASSSSANLTSSILYRGWWPLHPSAVVRGSGPPSSLYNIHFDLSCDTHVPWLTVMLTFCNMQTPAVRWQNSVVTSHHHQGSAGKQAGTEDLPAFNILFSSFHLNRKVYFHSIRWMCQSSSSASIYRNNFIICIFGIFFFSQKSNFGDIL